MCQYRQQSHHHHRNLLLLLVWLGTVIWLPAFAAEEPLPLAIELRQRLLQPPAAGDSPVRWGELNNFYAARHFLPVWLGPEGPNARATLLRKRLLQAGEEGLEPERYQNQLIARLWTTTTPDDRLNLELLLSGAFFDYVRDNRSGSLDPQQVSPLWRIERPAVDPVTTLRLALLSGDFRRALDALPPSHPAYLRLRQALAHYRHLDELGGWELIPAGSSLQLGMDDARVSLLRRRLEVEGDLALPSAKATLFDEPLRYAVERFQVRHGLEVDGVVGRQTLAALNVSAAERIGQIKLNMERWRWLPQQLGRRYLLVNIPSYQLIAYDDGEAQLSIPVIIGTRDRRTPVTSGRLHSVVFNPYWTVPRNIALRDLIPRQRRNPDYMPSHHIRVFADWNGNEELDPQQIDWNAVNWNHFPYMLRQDPGPKNPLGKAKFLFTNPYKVYLHDTPDEALFADNTRAYSSGCIRLEEPLRLATFLLAGEGGWGWDQTMVQQVIASGLTYDIPLSTPIPVYLLYLTTWVGEDGVTHFSRDIYDEDLLLGVCMPGEEPKP
jgi:murein L,D-transpeptidase YcbB/YkuD